MRARGLNLQFKKKSLPGNIFPDSHGYLFEFILFFMNIFTFFNFLIRDCL